MDTLYTQVMQHPPKVIGSRAADGGGFAVGGDLTLGIAGDSRAQDVAGQWDMVVS